MWNLREHKRRLVCTQKRPITVIQNQWSLGRAPAPSELFARSAPLENFAPGTCHELSAPCTFVPFVSLSQESAHFRPLPALTCLAAVSKRARGAVVGWRAANISGFGCADFPSTPQSMKVGGRRACSRRAVAPLTHSAHRRTDTASSTWARG